MLRGMTTVSYWAADMEAARAWYTELLGVEPYFERPGGGQPAAYLEFRIGDYQHELGLDRRPLPPAGRRHRAGRGDPLLGRRRRSRRAFDRLLAIGATAHDKPTPRGEGFVTASVVDPFGNVLGVMENPHYHEVLAAR